MNRDFFDSLQKLVAETWPGTAAVEIVIKLNTGQKAKMPVPMPAFKVSVVAGDAFVPNAVQTAILKALEGKALKTNALVAVAGSKSQLFRVPGGIQELRDRGLVEHHDRLGFYRPDMPPPSLDLSEADEGKS